MKRITLFALLIFLGLNFCIGQSKQGGESEMKELPKTKKETKNQPQTNIKVNKEYDKQGNIISYDSTYTWSYSSDGENTAVSDSMLNEFKHLMNMDAPISMDDFFNDKAPEDTTSTKETNINELFARQRRQNMELMRRFMSEMDSVQSNPDRAGMKPRLNQKSEPKKYQNKAK